ncbi:MAG: energy-coupling factor transporter ATPase [Lachnospiraceae bacterium]|nr:energy-coupling factor transporter ATPase [Lachnospiraceae bacterium]
MSIILDHLCHTYEAGTTLKSEALKDISLKIDDGEFIGLIGHTGSGKSTLVQHLNGLLKPTSGNIYYNGADINDSDYDIKSLRKEVGLVFQYPEHQLFETDVFSDVCFGPKNMGFDKKEVELTAYSALETVGIDHDLFYVSPFDLSGGQKRRVAIAGVLAMKPKVLILDEPTAGLDPAGRDEILGLVRKLHKENGITVILVSHSMEDVANNVGRIIVMERGGIFMDGTPTDIFARSDELETIGLAAPEVTYIMRALKKKGLDVNTFATTIDEAVPSILSALKARKC